MKKTYMKAAVSLALLMGLTGCGDKFLESNIYDGIDSETALDNVKNVGYALNGTYYRLHQYYFAGNYSTMIGDIASDISYWNTKTGHFDDIYRFSPRSTNTYLKDIWNYGYKVVDNSSRVIKAGKTLSPGVSGDEKATLDLYVAEAYALRGYADLVLLNVFGHQVKVNGTDYSSQPGIVIVDEPVEAFSNVKRSSVGECYASVVSDLKKSLEYFDAAGFDRGDVTKMNPAAVWALLARTYCYLEDWKNAADAADKALELKGISSLADTPDAYAALYAGGTSNTESFFTLGINTTTNWSANSCGTLWTNYGYSPSPWLQSVMAEDDCRRAVWGWGAENTPQTPYFNGGKFYAPAYGGNTACATNYIINAPEMFLIKAEALAHQPQASVADVQAALLTVARRNPAIASASDLPATKADLLTFLHDERARELFQEGLRLYDLRRWGLKVNVYATGAPAIQWLVKDYQVANAVFPIPDAEVNAGYGVTQTPDWTSGFPNM